MDLVELATQKRVQFGCILGGVNPCAGRVTPHLDKNRGAGAPHRFATFPMPRCTRPLLLAFLVIGAIACAAEPCDDGSDGGYPDAGAFNDGGACALGRHADDQADDSDADQIHVMYVLASDSTDEELDTSGAIETSVTAANHWLAAQTGGPRLRFDTCGGRLDVTFVRLDKTSDVLKQMDPGRLPQTVEDALRTRGLIRPKKIYAVYYGGEYDQCGQSDWPPAFLGQIAVVFPKGGTFFRWCGSIATCRSSPGKFEAGLIHEVFHALGAVATCAPHHDTSHPGHVTDDSDLMNGVHLASEQSALDVGRDDYFGHNNPACVDVAQSAFLDPSIPGAREPPGWWMGMPSGIVGGCATDRDCPPPLPLCCPGGTCALNC